MSSSEERSGPGCLASGRCTVSEIAAEIAEKLQYEDFRNALDRFLSRYPKYEKYKESLLNEGTWAIIACAVAASCHSLGNPRISGDIVGHMELPRIEPERSLPKRGRRKRDDSVPDGVSRITDYISVFRYVLTRSRNIDPDGNHHFPTSLKSVGLLMVKNVLMDEHAMSSDFEDTVHLLDELILPVLTATFIKFTAPFGQHAFRLPRFTHSLYGT